MKHFLMRFVLSLQNNINLTMSKVAAYYHIVFCTKRQEMTIPLQYKEDVYRFIWKVISDSKCTLIRIGGIQNHVHILLNLHPTVALANLIQSIKSISSGWIAQDGRFKLFDGWASGYFATTVSSDVRQNVIDYIKSQKTHHLRHPFDDEMKRLYMHANMDFDERDMR